jgi:hypothetical protein
MIDGRGAFYPALPAQIAQIEMLSRAVGKARLLDLPIEPDSCPGAQQHITAVLGVTDRRVGRGDDERGAPAPGGSMTMTTRDQHHFDSVMGSTMWGCMATLWVLLAGLIVAALVRWAL